MKNTKEDLRTQKTYKALTQAFLELIAEKSFDQISVVELCKRANTRTATFYNHFSDKYDFFSFVIYKARDISMSQAELEEDKNHPEQFYVNLIRNGFAFLEEHSEMIDNVDSDTLLSTIMQTVSDRIVVSISDHIKKDTKRTGGQSINPDIWTQAFLGAVIKCSRWWYDNRHTVSKEEVISQLELMIKSVFQANEKL